MSGERRFSVALDGSEGNTPESLPSGEPPRKPDQAPRPTRSEKDLKNSGTELGPLPEIESPRNEETSEALRGSVTPDLIDGSSSSSTSRRSGESLTTSSQTYTPNEPRKARRTKSLCVCAGGIGLLVLSTIGIVSLLKPGPNPAPPTSAFPDPAPSAPAHSTPPP